MAPLLEVQGLNAWYGESHILHGIDMMVGEGEMITILGRNGVGKTTTLRTITGIVRSRKGKISFAGTDMMQVPLHKTAHKGIGFVPEERGIFSTLTVSENLMLPPVVASGGMLPQSKHVLTAWADILQSAAQGTLVIDCSTIDVESSRKAHEMAKAASCLSLDAPVSGGTGGASAGTLTFMEASVSMPTGAAAE